MSLAKLSQIKYTLTDRTEQILGDGREVLKPYLPVLAASAATAVGKEVPNAIKSLWDAIHDHLSRREVGREALEDVTAHPDDSTYLTVFLVQMQKALERGDAFPAELRRLLETARSETHYQATQRGSGAIAQGPGAKAVGERGVLIEGDVKGSVIVTGDDNEVNVEG